LNSPPPPFSVSPPPIPGRIEDIRKGCRRVNMVGILMYENGKMRPVETSADFKCN
jgi:hypothetical protein